MHDRQVRVHPDATFASEFTPQEGEGRSAGAQRMARGRAAEIESSETCRFSIPTMDWNLRVSPAKSGKSIMISELHQLARSGRCLIVYHHTLAAQVVIMPRCSTGLTAFGQAGLPP